MADLELKTTFCMVGSFPGPIHMGPGMRLGNYNLRTDTPTLIHCTALHNTQTWWRANTNCHPLHLQHPDLFDFALSLTTPHARDQWKGSKLPYCLRAWVAGTYPHRKITL